jgi:tRNA-Thr(GGU) m(6)t(6)A37 methyltransferase TsaA
MSNENGKPKTYQLHPVGWVQASDEEQRYILQIDKPYRAGLKELDQFSHVLIFWWADKMDNEKHRQITTTKLPYAPGVEAGVFACRAEYRPNPIAVTLMAMISVDVEQGIVVLPWIDAFDGSPVLDLKPYIPISDRVRDYKVADWLADWPEWMEDAAEYFAEHETDFGE